MSNETGALTEIDKASSSAQASPSKVPASLSSKTKEELAELLVSTLRQLKARDKRLRELSELSVTKDKELQEGREREEREERVRADEREKREKRIAAELAELKAKYDAMEKEHAELLRLRAEESERQQAYMLTSSEEEVATLRKSQAKLKKAVVELKKRNESLDVRQKEAEAARCAAVDDLRKAEAQVAAQVAAFAEYKQKAHALLKSKDEEIKNGSTAIREALEAEVAAEKAARKAAELARDTAVEELGTVQSQVAGQIHEIELQHKNKLVCFLFCCFVCCVLGTRGVDSRSHPSVLFGRRCSPAHPLTRPLCSDDVQAQLQKELDLQVTHAKNSAKRLQQLQVRYDSAQQRYESLRNSKMNGSAQQREGDQPVPESTVDGRESASNARLDEALQALERAKAEASASAQIKSVLEQEVASLTATVNQLKMTLAMKKSIKTPFYDHVGENMPASPFSPAAEGDRDATQATESTGATTSTSLQKKLSMAERKASVAEREVDDLELEIKLREAQEQALKSTIRELEGEIHRLKLAFGSDGVDMEYLKNILVQVFKGAQDEFSLLQVVAKILRLSSEEFQECAKAIKARKTQADAGYLPDLSSLIPTSFLS